jgi:phage protein D
MPSSNLAILPTRPARPTIEIDGERQATLTAALLSLEIADAIEGMTRCSLTLGNWGGADHPGFQHFDRRTVEFGKALAIKVGDETLFEGKISAIAADYPDGGPPKIGILAEDRLQDLRMVRRTRCFADKSLADLVRSIAGDHGLQAQVDLSGSATKVQAQLNQSDLAFLNDLARHEDAEVWVEGDALHAAKTRGGEAIELAWAGPLREFHVAADLTHQRTALVASGWDVAERAVASNRAEAAAISAELGQDVGGAAILRQAFGERVDTLAHGLPRDGGEARVLAEASFRHMARRFVTGHGVAESGKGVKVGSKLKLSGLGPLFDGDYRATAVTHRFDNAKGLRTEFRCDRPGIGRP